MIFSNIFYIITLITLFIGIVASFKEYFNTFISNSENFYLLLAIIFVFFNYIIQYYMVLTGIYYSGMVLFGHIMKVYGFWGILSFLITQLHYKNKYTYRINKLLIFLFFILFTSIASSILIQESNLYTVSKAQNIFHKMSLVANKYADITLEIICLISSVLILLPIKKIGYLSKKFLYISSITSILSYLLSVLNLFIYDGINYTLFLISHTLGSIASMAMAVVIWEYFNKLKLNKKLMENTI